MRGKRKLLTWIWTRDLQMASPLLSPLTLMSYNIQWKLLFASLGKNKGFQTLLNAPTVGTVCTSMSIKFNSFLGSINSKSFATLCLQMVEQTLVFWMTEITWVRTMAIFQKDATDLFKHEVHWLLFWVNLTRNYGRGFCWRFKLACGDYMYIVCYLQQFCRVYRKYMAHPWVFDLALHYETHMWSVVFPYDMTSLIRTPLNKGRHFSVPGVTFIWSLGHFYLASVYICTLEHPHLIYLTEGHLFTNETKFQYQIGNLDSIGPLIRTPFS
jgi:hypothetical protein